MPPPGVPDWVFPGAVIIDRNRGGRPMQNRSPAGHWVITNLDMHPDAATIEVNISPSFTTERGRTFDDNRFETLTLDGLLASWQPTGEWLYRYTPRPRQEPHTPDAIQALQFYRWSDGPTTRFHSPPVRLIFITRIANNSVFFDTVSDEVEHSIAIDHFLRELDNGNIEFLGHESVFYVPRNMDDLYHVGDGFLDGEGQEFFLSGQTREVGAWIVRASHDLSEFDHHYLRTARRLDWHPLDELAHDDDIPNEPLSGPLDDADVPYEETDDDPFVSAMVEVGDRWHFGPPNEGIWTLMAKVSQRQFDRTVLTNEFRSEDGARMTGDNEWVIENGRRVSPPDPRFTGAPIAARQVWEIPTNQTRRNNSRWRVTKVEVQATISMVELEPVPGQGAHIFWPEVRLRAQGRLVSDGLVRRTAFERILGEDEDS